MAQSYFILYKNTYPLETRQTNCIYSICDTMINPKISESRTTTLETCLNCTYSTCDNLINPKINESRSTTLEIERKPTNDLNGYYYCPFTLVLRREKKFQVDAL